jgi:hypothetical protein
VSDSALAVMCFLAVCGGTAIVLTLIAIAMPSADLGTDDPPAADDDLSTPPCCRGAEREGRGR